MTGITEGEKQYLLEKYQNAENWYDIGNPFSEIPYSLYNKFEYVKEKLLPDELRLAIEEKKSISSVYQRVWNKTKPELSYNTEEELVMEPFDDWNFVLLPLNAEVPTEAEKIENGKVIYFDNDEQQRTMEEVQLIVLPKTEEIPENAVRLPPKDKYKILIPETEICKYTNIRTTEVSFRLFDVWNFSGCDKRWGIRKIDPEGILYPNGYPGQIPGQIICNLLHYYTKPKDLVVDFMAGGGTTQDVCEDKVFQRRCLSFDKHIGPDGNSVRSFIKQHNLRDEQGDVILPELSEKPKLIFTDPPYWSMMDEDYGEGSISGLTLEGFYDFIKKYSTECHKVLERGGIFAFLIEEQGGRDLPEGVEEIFHVRNCTNIIESVGFELRRVIDCPLPMSDTHQSIMNKAKREKKLLTVRRCLLIFRK